MEPLGIYIHIPFCRQKCPYCDFYSLPADALTQETYVQAVLQDLENYRERGLTADTLYFGGGTPSLLHTDLLKKLLDKVAEVFSLPEEISLEANPGTVDLPKLNTLRKIGFNRISFGMQSAVEEERKLLGRQHTLQDVKSAVLWAKEAGFSDISVDLMLGTPKQTLASIEESLSFLSTLPIDHTSAYLLKIEEGTAFARQEIIDLLPDEDTSCDIYLTVCSRFAEMGFSQYEISNFARSGKECRHNLKYWNRQPYLGFGPTAHSFFEGKRFFYSRDLADYIAFPGQHQLLEEADPDPLTEYFAMSFRLTRGISLRETEKLFHLPADVLLKTAAPFLQHHLMQQEGDRLFLTPEGFLLSNSIITEFLMLQE